MMTFEDLGATLRAEREKKNLNLDDIAAQLKISPRLLRSLEEGDIDALPHPSYARGFIRSYATYLGMSGDEVREALDIIQNPGAPRKKPKKDDDTYLPEPEPAPRKGRKGLYFLLILAILGSVTYYAMQNGGWEFVKQKLPFLNDLPFLSSTPADKKLSSAEDVLSEKNVESPKGEIAREAVGEPKVIPANEPKPSLAVPPVQYARDDENAGKHPIERELETPLETPDTPQAAPAVTAPQTPGHHKLIITAVEECWVHSNADKTDTRQFSLRKGDTFALTFADSLELKLGNAGGVRLRYDGSDLPAPGTSGQVKTITFPPSNNS